MTVTREGVEKVARELREGSRKFSADGSPTMTPEQARRRVEQAVTHTDNKRSR
jgi:hypothetical protein